MMDWLTEPFELALQQRALIGGILAALSTALVGTWVVIRGMTFLGDALVHGVIPGIALALLLDVPSDPESDKSSGEQQDKDIAEEMIVEPPARVRIKDPVAKKED